MLFRSCHTFVYYFQFAISEFSVEVRKNSSRVQEAALSLLCWLDSSSPKSQLWCATIGVSPWVISIKENWFSPFSSQLVDPLENNLEIILHITEKETL